jgi:hypothetical protein
MRDLQRLTMPQQGDSLQGLLSLSHACMHADAQVGSIYMGAGASKGSWVVAWSLWLQRAWLCASIAAPRWCGASHNTSLSLHVQRVAGCLQQD